MTSITRVPPHIPHDEIDLLALFRSLWRQKLMICAVAALFGLIAIVYAFASRPVYQVSSVLRPAAINELDALNRSEIYTLSPPDALLKVGASLDSYETRLGFFRSHQDLFKRFEREGQTLEQSFEEFNRNSIDLVLPDPKRADLLSAFIGLEMSYPKGVNGPAIMNGLVDYAIQAEVQQIASDLEVIIHNRLNELDGRIDAARSSYETQKQAHIASLQEVDNVKRAQLQDELKALRVQLKAQRTDRMAQLAEAISIAKSLGIKRPSTPSSLGDADRSGSASVMRTEVNNQQIPLYFMGSEALEAERTALQQRKTDDFASDRITQIEKELQMLQNNRQIEVMQRRENEDIFLKGVEPLREEIVRLRNLNIDMKRLKLVTIDRRALESTSPIKPNKPLVTLLALFLGGLVGLLVAIIRYLVLSRRLEVIHLEAPSPSPVIVEERSVSNGKGLTKA
ncbi:Wzz/FepE/Etk N-terminal domain-containing protein [Xanthomonas sp. WHRI 1810A]|uniref:Wzz/FepE/Etk N-terminal domain-containing protein n=1 Tax=Xanthomonas sp. WHRI 1810A TaxID=3161565 RepID=UPI0032E88288